jgi:hypothetical protein
MYATELSRPSSLNARGARASKGLVKSSASAPGIDAAPMPGRSVVGRFPVPEIDNANARSS